ncbi:hypothetical protein LTR29_009691 [Friedmanniomyces endolithicus]|nr:hypothetical protein LTR29_009691 [Friedmanniomyces endolithicus]
MHQAQVQGWGQAPKYIEANESAPGPDETRITENITQAERSADLADHAQSCHPEYASDYHEDAERMPPEEPGLKPVQAAYGEKGGSRLIINTDNDDMQSILPPHVPGVDGVGKTDDGQLVYWFSMERGTMADRVNIPKRNVRPLPEGTDPVHAAGIVNPALSSWMALKTRTEGLPADFTVLIVGATSASGRVAISLARALGAKKVIGAARNKTVLGTLGLDAMVVLADKPEDTDWSSLGDVDVILDYVYGPVTAHLLASLKSQRLTQYVHIGGLSGQELLLPGAVLRSKNLTIRGSGPGAWRMQDVADSIDELLEVVKGVPEQPIKLVKLKDIEAVWDEPVSAGRLVIQP